MSRMFIPVAESVARWMQDPEFVREYDALEEEFACPAQIVGARARAGLSQAELATRMTRHKAP